METTDQKRRHILDAAAKRFAHFGLSKTTMNDIAKDLSYSKALLYYYFPNKDELYTNVFIDIIEKMAAEIDQGIQKQESVENAILFYLEKRQDFIVHYYKLLVQPPKTRQTLSPKLKATYMQSLQKEVKRIEFIFEQGCQRGEIQLEDPEKTAKLLLAAISGLRFSSFQLAPPSSFPDLNQLQDIYTQSKALASIFCKGLSCSNVR